MSATSKPLPVQQYGALLHDTHTPSSLAPSSQIPTRSDSAQSSATMTSATPNERDVNNVPPNEEHDDGSEDLEANKSTWYLILLTISIGGLQIVWCVELASVSPFLLSLGLSKSLMALVWIAGPLSGTLVQPYVGIKSDDCRLRFGRRRPFMVGGAVATMLSLLALAWTREIVNTFMSIFGANAEANSTVIARQIFAVVFVYILDFAINVIQAGIRAFIIDCAPTQQQEAANAWASRITGVGNIVGYLAGYVNLPSILPFLGTTQFQVLCALACVILSSTLALSCLTVHERDPRLFGQPSEASKGVLGFFKDLHHAISRLPVQIRRVCQVQLFAWIGWFPFLFYVTTYVGGVYAEPFFAENPNMSQEEVDAVWERGTRVGALALLVFAITTFSASVIVPFLVQPSFADASAGAGGDETSVALSRPSTASSSTPLKARPSLRSLNLGAKGRACMQAMRIPRFTLRRAWLLSHLVFCLLMWLTLFVRSTASAIVLVGAVGVPWALTNWAPFALIAADISARDTARRRQQIKTGMFDGQTSSGNSQGDFNSNAGEAASYIEAGEEGPLGPEDEGSPSDQAGVVLGIHNVSISAPQVIATLVSSWMFWLLQKERGQPGDGSVGWVLRAGGLAALGAAWVCRWVGEPGRQGTGYSSIRQRDE